MRINGYQLLAQEHDIAVILQRFAITFLFDLGRAFQSLLDCAEALDQFDRALVADSRGSGDVVDRVTAQGHHIHHALWRHSQNFFYLGGIADQIVLGRIQHTDFVVHQLQHVLVAGNDVDGIGFRGSLAGQRADYVIRLVALGLQDGNAVGLERAADVGHLLCQVFGHLFAIGLVAAIGDLLKFLCLDVELTHRGDGAGLLVAKGGGCYVEDCREVLGIEVVAQLAEHVHKDVDGSGRKAGLGGHGSLTGHRVVGAEDERHRVYEENTAFVAGRRLRFLDGRRLGYNRDGAVISAFSRGFTFGRQGIILTGTNRGLRYAGISLRPSRHFFTNLAVKSFGS